MRPRELVWVTVAVGAEALLAGRAAAAGFSLPALLLLLAPALTCWTALKLRIDGAEFERWVLDMGLFLLRGRVLCTAPPPQRRGSVRFNCRIGYRIECPGRSLRNGSRTNRGFSFEIAV